MEAPGRRAGGPRGAWTGKTAWKRRTAVLIPPPGTSPGSANWSSTAGHRHGGRIISERYIKAATSPASWLVDGENRPVDFYGYQFWIMHHRGLTIPCMRGIHGQYVFIIPEKNAVVVRLGKKRSEMEKDHMRKDAYEYVDAALELMK